MKEKKNILLPILTSFVFSFTFLFFGTYEIFVSNSEELVFGLSNFIVPVIIISLSVFVALSLILIFVPGIVGRILNGIVFGLTICGYIQGNFLNIGVNSLISDDVGSAPETWFVILDVAIWVILLGGIIFAFIMTKKVKVIKTVAIFLCVLLVGMQGTALVTESISYSNKLEEQGNSLLNDTDYILTTRGLYEVSKKNNVIIIVLDRFDISYYEDVVDEDPEFFNKLEDFTLYTDNVSLYARTYPSIATMVTNVDNDFSATAAEYFEYAYNNSDFLNDLEANDYRIKVYTGNYYSYRNASALRRAYNVQPKVGEMTVPDTWGLAGSMIQLSLYRYFPIILKSTIRIASTSFSKYIAYEEVYPVYTNDSNVEFCQNVLNNGLSLDNKDNAYTFIHLHGCHDPVTMDEDCNEFEEGVRSVSNTRGCFKMIYEYISELKRLGVYNNSTIIITGDHPRARSDTTIPTQPRITALFVKQANPDGVTKPFTISTEPVSQANLFASIIKSAGIKTEKDYGKAYWEMNDGDNAVRIHKFQCTLDDGTHILEFTIKGNGRDFKNWEITNDTNIGRLYK